MKAIWLALLLTACAQPVKPSPEQLAKPSTAILGLTDGTCSGTLVGPKLVLSAAHCFITGRLLTVNNTPVNVLEYRQDGADHALLLLDTTFPSHSPVNFGGMAQGERVFMYGNPANLPDMIRRGYVSGTVAEGTLLDMPVSQGDSGAAIFNERGEVVGVLSGYMQAPSGFTLAVVRPFSSPFSAWAVVVED